MLKKLLSLTLTFVVLGLFTTNTNAQSTTVSTTGVFTNNNGSGQVTFNFQNNNGYAVIITGIEGVTGVAGAQTCDLWYKTTPLSGAPGVISSANGWNIAMSGSYTGVVNTTSTVTQPFITGGTFVVPAMTTYAFSVASTNQRYFTMTTNTTVSAGGCSIITGTNISYGGSMPPTTPPNTPRGWIGKITFVPSIKPFNDAGVASIDTPGLFCSPGIYPVYATIKNYGGSQITSVTANWSTNGISKTPYSFTGLLDTIGGVNPSTAQILLGTYNFPSTTTAIKVWTSLPNSLADTTTGNDTMLVNKHPSMSGTYTIAPTGGNYSTFTAACNDLMSFGVCGPVVFNVAAGTYTENVTLNAVAGNSSVNTIRFDGGNGNAATRIITTSALSTSTFVLNNTQYVTLRNLTINNTYAGSCQGIAITGTNVGTTINNCSVNLPNSGTSTAYGIATGGAYGGSSSMADSLTIDSNTVTGGYYGIYLYGGSTTAGSGWGYNRNFKVRYNTLSGVYYYNLYVYYIQNGIDIIGNTITNMGAGYYGLYMYYNYNHNATNAPTRIIGNKFSTMAYNYVYYATSTPSNITQIINNIVFNTKVYSTNYGFYISNPSTYNGDYLILNNTINLSSGTTTAYGVYYSNTTGGANTIIKNNIFSNAAGVVTTGYPLYAATNPTGNVINYNYYNNVSGTNLLFRGSAYTTATFKTALAGGDSSFIGPLPLTSSTDMHLTNGCTRGVNMSPLVTTDIDGTSRSLSPSVGAYEYVSYANDMATDILYTPVMPLTAGLQNLVVRVKNTGSTSITSFNINYTLNGGSVVTIPWSGFLNTCDTALITFSAGNQINIVTGVNAIKVYTSSPNLTTDGNRLNDTISVSYYYSAVLSGNYSIGGTGANFPDIATAATAISNYGINGPVYFTINPGTYTGQVVVSSVPGASSVNTITFDGVNASSRILSANLSSSAFLINQTSYVTIKNLTVTNSYAGACTGIADVGNATNTAGSGFNVKRCIVNLPNVGANTSYGIIVTGSVGGMADGNQWTDSVTIDSNTINGGYYGIQISTSASGNATYNIGHKIRWNTVNAYYYGIRVYYIYNAVEILYNTVNMNPINNSNYGIYFYYCQNTTVGTNHKIIGNNVYAGYAALYFYYFASPLGNRIPIYNNMFNTFSPTGYVAAYVYTGVAAGDEVDFYHNTVASQGATATYGLYFYNTGTGTSYLRNNIFYAVGSATYPAYFSTNPAGNVINFNNYYNAAGGNLGYRGAAFNSSNYLSTTTGGDTSYNVLPVFVSSTDLHLTNACLKGADLTAYVPTDIFGNVRSVPPVVGAHEASGSLNDVALVRVDYTTPIVAGLQNLTVKIKNNNTANITSLNVSYKLNGGTAVTVPWSGTMLGCDTLLVTFTGPKQLNILPGSNTLTVYTSQPNGIADVNTSNDTSYLALSTITKIAGNAFSGNGTGGNVISYAHVNGQNPSTAVTVEAWVKLSSIAVDQKFVCKSSVQNGYCLGFLTAGAKLDPEFWTVANGTGSLRMTSVGTSMANNTIPANTWTHVAATWQSGVGVKAYINGSLVGYYNSATVSTITPSTYPLVVGADSWDLGYATNGNLDEVRIWNVALDSISLRKNMHRTLTGTETGLISYMQINEPVSSTLLSDPICGSVGTKKAAAAIVASTLPAGGDSTYIIPYITSGLFQNANLTVNITDPFDNYCDLTITEVPFGPNFLPSVSHTLNNKYWIVQPFGNPGLFAADFTFNFPTGYLNLTDPSLGLYRRSFYGDQANWQYAKAGVVTSPNTLMCFNVDTLGQFTIASNGTSLLPVTLMSFGGKKINNAVNLLWQTANEINSKGFEIERSYNNLDYFEKIAFVDAKGANKASANAYNYIDTKADLSNVIYYRLKQLDNDGKYKYSPIVEIDADNSATVVSAYPNPLLNSTKIDLRVAQNVSAVISVYDIKGEEIMRFNQNLTKGANQINIDLSKLNSGIYISKIQIGDELKTIKLIKE